MRKRRNSKRDLIIDLTSLLDVIFIILLVVLCSQQLAQKQYKAQAQTAAEKMQEAETKEYLYNDQLDTQDNLNSYIFAISVYSDYNPEQLTIRNIHILKENEEIETLELRGTDTSETLTTFKNSLIKYIEEHREEPIILSCNERDEKILYRDEQAILQIFDELQNEYTNIFIKNRMGK